MALPNHENDFNFMPQFLILRRQVPIPLACLGCKMCKGTYVATQKVVHENDLSANNLDFVYNNNATVYRNPAVHAPRVNDARVLLTCVVPTINNCRST